MPTNPARGYTLEWRWVFDGDPERDTALGRKAAEQEVPYILKLSFAAEQNGPAVNPSQPDKPDSPQTGDNSDPTLWLAVAVCSGTALLLWRRYDGAEDENG